MASSGAVSAARAAEIGCWENVLEHATEAARNLILASIELTGRNDPLACVAKLALDASMVAATSLAGTAARAQQEARGELGIAEAREIAAQAWTDPETSSIVMDTRLAEAFARRLVEVAGSGRLPKV